jgi:hypothetical protein
MYREQIIDNDLVNPPKFNPKDAGSSEIITPVPNLVLPDPVWRGAFKDYRTAMKDATEAPDAYHFSTLLVRAGAALGRRIWFDYGMRLYPNFYCVNFGPSGDRKTTAQRYFDDLGTDLVRKISGASSGEALADEFQDLPPGTPCVLSIEEFAELLRRGRWDGSTVLQFLTTCFDCPPRYQLKFRKNPVDLLEPTPSLLAGSTPDWFWQSARSTDFRGGFANRILYFTGKRKAAIPLPSVPDLKGVRATLDALSGIQGGSARLSPKATELWQRLYPTWEMAQDKRDPMLRVALERIPPYTLKTGMVYAAFEQTFPQITRDQLRAAILVGDFCAKCAAELLSLQNAGTNPTKELERRILDFVTQQPQKQAKKRQIYRALWRHYTCAEQFDRSFRALVRTGELCEQLGGKGSSLVSIP